MKQAIFVTLAFVFALSCRAQELLDLSTALMRSTYKLEGKDSLGTAFVLGDPITGRTNVYRYVMMTAAHVLDAAQGDTAILHLRVKKGDDYSRLPHRIQIRDHGTNTWTAHPAADVAAMYVYVPTQLDITLLPTDQIFADDEFIIHNEIRPGEQLFALGYPFGAEANESGFPILRSGAIASYPLVPANKVRTFLFDFEVYRGNSGGPVFIYATNRTIGGKTPMVGFCRIMGLVSQEKLITEQVQSLYEDQKKKHPLSVGVVVHASFVRETIDLLRKKEPMK